jgi:hypothetical protein
MKEEQYGMEESAEVKLEELDYAELEQFDVEEFLSDFE